MKTETMANGTVIKGENDMANDTTSKAANIGLWILQILLAAMFLMAGFSKLSGAPEMVGLYEKIGIGQWFRYATGIIEVGSAILLLIPRFAGIGGLLLIGTMIGAIATHLFIVGGSPLLPIILLVIAGIIAYGRVNRTRETLGL
jgi:putative oxidoreductase